MVLPSFLWGAGTVAVANPFVLPPPAVCTDNDVDVPKAWEESDPRYIADSQEVRLRSFTTKVFAALRRARACVCDDDVFATRGAQPLFFGNLSLPPTTCRSTRWMPWSPTPHEARGRLPTKCGEAKELAGQPGPLSGLVWLGVSGVVF